MMNMTLIATSAAVFGVLYAVGAGVTGATGFYSVTTVSAARLRPDRPERAIAVLTVLMLQGCGRKGALEPPPGDEDENALETNGGY